MDADSAVEPDGYSWKFFTFAWEVVGNDVYAVVCSFFFGAKLPWSVTVTSIILLPKASSPQVFSQNRLINLCNFINKIISNLLAMRLAKVLPIIISSNHNGFVQGRQISDNFLLLAQE